MRETLVTILASMMWILGLGMILSQNTTIGIGVMLLLSSYSLMIPRNKNE